MHAYRPEDFKPKLPPGALPRRDFLALADLSPSSLYSLARRGQLPVLPAAVDAPAFIVEEARKARETEGDAYDARGWTCGSAYAYVLQRMLIDQHACGVDFACAVARHYLLAVPRWAEITRGAEQVLAGQPLDPGIDLLLAVVLPRGSDKTEAAVGTLREIAEKSASAASIIGTSLIDAAVTLRKRAGRHRIDVSHFWATGP